MMAKFNPMDILGGVVGGMNPAGAIVGAIVGQVLHRSDVPMNNADVPATQKKVAQAVADAVNNDKIAVVPVTRPSQVICAKSLYPTHWIVLPETQLAGSIIR